MARCLRTERKRQVKGSRPEVGGRECVLPSVRVTRDKERVERWGGSIGTVNATTASSSHGTTGHSIGVTRRQGSNTKQ